MNVSAGCSGRGIIRVYEPIRFDMRYEMVERDFEMFAELNDADIAALYDALPHGASQSERNGILCYLCGVAEEVELA